MTPSFDPAGAHASFVIPAYNEGRVLARCLDALHGYCAAADARCPLHVVVAANGCTDDTVAVARRYRGVTVVDIPDSSKRAALDAGDEAAGDVFPRVYLDADIVLDHEAISGLVTALSTPRAVVASPRIRFVTAGASWPVRSFYRAYERLPYVTDGLIGLGVYGVSRAGRARFETFPDVAGDDLFVQRLFADEERIITSGHFDVQVPRDLANLMRVRTRVARGTVELARAPLTESGDFSQTATATARALARLVAGQPSLAPHAATYAAVVIAARGRAQHPGTMAWQRDESTR